MVPCQVCSEWLGGSVSGNHGDLKRVQQLLVSSLNKITAERQHTSLYGEAVATMESLAVLNAWAEVCCATCTCTMSYIYSVWVCLETYRVHCRLYTKLEFTARDGLLCCLALLPCFAALLCTAEAALVAQCQVRWPREQGVVDVKLHQSSLTRGSSFPS